MRRKLIRQAGQALTITVPIEWVRENSLKAGDEIKVEIKEKNLILRSGKKISGGSLKLDMAGFSSRMEHIYINAAYAKGIDEIEVESSHDICKKLGQDMGFAVIEQKGNRYVIRDISGVSSEDMDTIFKRVFQMIIGFYGAAIDDIFGQNKESIESVHGRDGEINKFVLFLQRSIIKMAYPESSAGKVIFAYSFALEKIGDEIFRIWRTSIEHRIRKGRKTKELLLLSQEGLQKAFEIYYQCSPEKVKELIAIKDSARKKALEQMRGDPATARFVMHAVKIVEDAADLTHLALMRSMKAVNFK